jgi:ABC-type long-subunit fatty acid transport system fused permease/ATPase subunit
MQLFALLNFTIIWFWSLKFQLFYFNFLNFIIVRFYLFKFQLLEFDTQNFSILHFKIKIIKKYFWNLKDVKNFMWQKNPK